MTIVRINAYKAGLVFRNGALKKVLREGLYFLSPFDRVEVYDMTQPFTSRHDLNLLLKNAGLAEALEVVIVKDNEIAVRFEDGIVKSILTVGKYVFWKGVVNRNFVTADTNEIRIPAEFGPALLQRRELVQFIRVYTVESWEKGLLLVNGKLEQTLEPGNYFFWKNDTMVAVLKADMRQVQLEIAGQELLTRDKASLRLSMFAQYRVKDVEKALTENKDFEKQLYVLLQLKLREFVGKLTLDELLDRKDGVADAVRSTITAEAEALGTVILNCGIRDIILPGEVKEIMNRVLVAEKKAQANTIMRREETASTRSLLNTAKLMEENQMLFRLKEMEFVEKIAEKINTISVSGNSQLSDQLRQLFVPEQK
ncbi:MAG: hypothetical protein FD123_454 [Bacteroidetes bacterium]|nr:MAG: hypothetical protein FD123_454 [Bacteroidota bacterium]